MIRIAFAWPGLPDYAARCIFAVKQGTHEPCHVVATRPDVPIEGMERSLGQSVHWINGKESRLSWESLNLQVPNLLFMGGYSVPAFNALAAQVRAHGGRVVLMSDNNWQGTIRQWTLDSWRHRLFMRYRFDGVFVPGASGVRVARRWGYRDDVIATGLYGADPVLFRAGPPLAERSKTFLFVGQFIARKNVVGLAEAFVRFAEKFPDWSLSLCGSGIQRGEIPRHPRIDVHGFVQPAKLAELLQSVRCLVLPSLVEHWGLVVHEAALSGCALALTTTIGAADDLAGAENSVLFPPGNSMAIGRALSEIASWSDQRWRAAECLSLQRAQRFGPAVFAGGVNMLRDRLIKTA